MFLNLVFSLFNCVQGAAYVPVEFDITTKQGARLTVEMRPIQTTLGDRLCFEKTYGSPVVMEKYMTGIVRPQSEIDKRFKDYTEWTNHKGYPWVCAMAFLKSIDAAGTSPLTPGQFLGALVIEPWNKEGDAELAYALVAESWNQGICTALVGKLLGSVVPCLRGNMHMYNINRLWATARPDNPGSWKVLERNGFQREEGICSIHSSAAPEVAAGAVADRQKYFIQIA
ncbi:MAG: GNAT family N-acetyltransferase [Pseudomonadota bacterium]